MTRGFFSSDFYVLSFALVWVLVRDTADHCLSAREVRFAEL